MSAVELRSPPLLESEPEPECAGHVVKSGSEERGSRERERETERKKEGETEERCVREDLEQAAARFRLLFSLSPSRSLSLSLAVFVEWNSRCDSSSPVHRRTPVDIIHTV